MKKVALVFVCVNQRYWPYLKDVLDDSKRFFLTNHKVDSFVWSDLTEEGILKWIDACKEPFNSLNFDVGEEELKNTIPTIVGGIINVINEIGHYKPEFTNLLHGELRLKHGFLIESFQDNKFTVLLSKSISKETFEGIRNSILFLIDSILGPLKELPKQATIFPIEPIEWPYPTLMRYHLFLQQEDILKDYDYVFYLDADMRIVDVIGDEIMGEGITMAEHPMYAIDRKFIPPYEPNNDSTAYIKRPGIVLEEDGKKWFKPFYAAGGFQGGKTDKFIEAMKVMKKNIDKDFASNYIAIWNDESHWNKYLFENPPSVILSPSYVYPDSLINEYYIKIWGRNYIPKIITLTKKFTTSKDGAASAGKMISELQGL